MGYTLRIMGLGMTDETRESYKMEEILERASKLTEAAELYVVTSESTPVVFETNRLKNIEHKQSTISALRVIKNRRTGYAVATGAVNAARLVSDALETAAFGQVAKFELPARLNYPLVDVFDPGVETVTLEQMVGFGERLIERIRANTPEIQCGAALSKGTATVLIMNTRGGDARYITTDFSYSLEGTLVRGTDMLFVGDAESSCHPLSDGDSVVNTVINQLERARETASVATKTMPVIFTPDGITGTLMPSLMSAFNGKVVYQGASPLAGRTGEKVFDDKLYLTDDATVPYRPNSRPCDDEGIPSRRTALIEEGVVKNFLYDLQTAGMAGAKSTGNGERGRGSLPAPAPSAFIITPGNTTFEEMVGDIKEGLLIEQVMGAEQGNILNGDFSGNVLLGYKIENGQITGRVKNTMIAGNVFALLKDIAAIGNDVKWEGGFLATPSFYFPALAVATKD
jgi:PmbA protein